MQQGLIQQDSTRALQAYRHANAAIRPTPPPAYFAEYPDVRRDVEDNVVGDILRRLSAARDGAQRILDTYQDQLNTKLNALQGEIAAILDRTFSDFVADVERQAADRI